MNTEEITETDDEEECFVFAIPEGGEEDDELIINIVPPEEGFAVLAQPDDEAQT